MERDAKQYSLADGCSPIYDEEKEKENREQGNVIKTDCAGTILTRKQTRRTVQRAGLNAKRSGQKKSDQQKISTVVSNENRPSGSANKNSASSSSATVHFLLSSRHNKTVIAVEDGDGLMRQYALAGTSQDGRRSCYRCNRCECRIRQGASGRIARVKTLDGELIGNAHPTHVDGCVKFGRNEVFVRAVLRECRREIRTNKKAPREAYAEALDRILTARDLVSRADGCGASSGGSRTKLIAPPAIPEWQKVNKAFYWQARQANNPANNRPLSPDRVLDPPQEMPNHLDIIDESLLHQSEKKTESLADGTNKTIGSAHETSDGEILRRTELCSTVSSGFNVSEYKKRFDLDSTLSSPLPGSFLDSQMHIDSSLNFSDDISRSPLASVSGSISSSMQTHSSKDCSPSSAKTFYMVETSQLMKLFKRCQCCGSILKDIKLIESGSGSQLEWFCTGDCGHSSWTIEDLSKV